MLTVLAVIFINGCVIMPTPSYGGVGVIKEDTVESLKPDKSTRADVLHLLGDPAYTAEEDRFFVYWWEQIEGYVIFLFPPLWPDREPGFAGREVQYLLVEFTPDNRLKRLKFIKNLPDRDMLNETLDQWTKEKE